MKPQLVQLLLDYRKAWDDFRVSDRLGYKEAAETARETMNRIANEIAVFLLQ